MLNADLRPPFNERQKASKLVLGRSRIEGISEVNRRSEMPTYATDFYTGDAYAEKHST
jgi:hypothetical protein